MNCFLSVEVGAPPLSAALMTRSFQFFEIYEGSPFFFGEVGEFGVAIRF